MCSGGKLEGGRGGRLEDDPTRRVLNGGVRFYEFGPGATRVYSQRYEIHTGGTKAGLIQIAHVPVFNHPRWGHWNDILAIVIQEAIFSHSGGSYAIAVLRGALITEAA